MGTYVKVLGALQVALGVIGLFAALVLVLVGAAEGVNAHGNPVLQAIGLAFGGQIQQAQHLMHGKVSMIRHDQAGCFKRQPNPFSATRYHSLVVSHEGLPDVLEVTARAEDDGYIMGLRHAVLPIESVQFHPESIRTDSGLNLFTSFVDRYLQPLLSS